MDLVVNHTSDEHPWFVESRSIRDNPKRDWYWWRPPRDGHAPGEPGAEPTNWDSFFSGPAWELDEATGRVLPAPVRPQAAGPELGEPARSAQAVYAMMRWWLDRGVDGFRMDVINFISKDAGRCPTGRAAATAPYGDGAAGFICGPRIHEFLAEMHGEVFAGRARRLLTVGEMPGVTVEEAVLFTDPARAEVDMVFQFEHVALDQGAGKCDVRPLRPARPQGVARPLAGRAGARRAGTASTGTTTTSRGSCPASATTARYRVQSAKTLATVLHLHRGTPYVYQGEELGMTNTPFTAIDDFRDIESLNHYAAAVAARRGPGAVLAALRRDGPRQRPHPDAVGRLAERRLHHRHALDRGQPRPPAGQRGRADRRPRLGVHALPPADRAAAHRAGGGARRLHDAAARRRRGLRVHPPYVDDRGEVELLVLGNFSGEEVRADVDGWDGAELVLGNYPDGGDGCALRAWEARVHRRILAPTKGTAAG